MSDSGSGRRTRQARHYHPALAPHASSASWAWALRPEARFKQRTIDATICHRLNDYQLSDNYMTALDAEFDLF
ncbi:hypothetical protein [Pseudomonas sp. LS-2]|jgi:hypothetical protein|uniref:hypothetical protein n=1 Tax=Pseudomonas sp. LS-2 TaxID=2315859 RepID=UPI0010591EDE|nr:hypothetical protein [Pseudomonas sp. LS-2]